MATLPGAAEHDTTQTPLDRMPGIPATYSVGRFQTDVKVVSWTSAGEPVLVDTTGRVFIVAVERVRLGRPRTPA